MSCEWRKRATHSAQRRRGHRPVDRFAAASSGYAHTGRDREPLERFRQRLNASAQARVGHPAPPASVLAAFVGTLDPVGEPSPRASEVRPSRPFVMSLALGTALLAALFWQTGVGRKVHIALTPREDLRATLPPSTIPLLQASTTAWPVAGDRGPAKTIVARDEEATGHLTLAAEDEPGDLQHPKAAMVDLAETRGPSTEASRTGRDIPDAPASEAPSKVVQSLMPAQLAALDPQTPVELGAPSADTDPGQCSADDQVRSVTATSPKPQAEDFGRALATAALRQTTEFVVYTDKYRKLAYPMGDVPALFGVCTDVVIRAYRAVGIDLQALIHASRIGSPDTSIAHRRTFTLRRYFASRGASVPITDFAEDYLPGDIVTYDRPQNSGSRDHIAIVSAINAPSGRPMIVHNRGWGPQLEDALFVDRITGHYRYRGRIDPILSTSLHKRRQMKNVALGEAIGVEPAASDVVGQKAVHRTRVRSAIVKRASAARAAKAKSPKKER